ncbi:hypothetical protein SJI00_14665 [Pseudomonas sp. RP23018S]|uniref:hypothetical protein n=1 Tax=Pseudomonas sp. RP23018S TaxID=3096037 RepID=UPI002ACAFCA9|nr:hypothetical protein [Pseudomonas sp. RP23018S]MDZ5604018.1 hypothetical protein [Pseudomonas sp. RP23018S]
MFLASTVKHYEEDEVLILALTDDAMEPEHFIIIARLDEDTNAAVDEGIGLQTQDAAYEMAQAISSVTFDGNRFEIGLRDAVVEHFGTSVIAAELVGEARALAEHQATLRQAIKVIFEGSDVQMRLGAVDNV